MKHRDGSSGELHTNKAGDSVAKDEKTTLLGKPLNIKTDKEPSVEADAQAEAEKTRVIYGSKKSKKREHKAKDVATQERSEVPIPHTVPCVGWLVVWDGPGKGASHVLQPGNNTIGRDQSCDVALVHGDPSISSDGKISIDYEYRGHTYAFVNRGSKNTPYLNKKPIRTECELKEGDILWIGETKLIFIPFCTTKRNWS